MEGLLLFAEAFVCCATALLLLHHYGDVRRQNRVSSLATFLSWCLSFLMLFLLPVDIASTLYRQCVNHLHNATSTVGPSVTPIVITTAAAIPTTSPVNLTIHAAFVTNRASATALLSLSKHKHSNDLFFDVDGASACIKPTLFVQDHVLQSLWSFIYWTSQLLTWIALPLMQSYANAGDFTVWAKLRSALIRNAIYYGTYFLVFGVLLIYVTMQGGFSFSKLIVIAITAANTWGLFLLVLLLGYGLVEVPRSTWHGCSHSLSLARTYFKISKYCAEKNEAEEQLEDCLEEIKGSAQAINYSHRCHVFMEVILDRCPESFRASIRPFSLDDYRDYHEDGTVGTSRVITSETSEKHLVRLHRRLIRSLQAYHRTQAQWEAVVSKALHLEDEVANLDGNQREFVRSNLTKRSDNVPLDNRLAALIERIYTPSVEWYWRCLFRSFLGRILACFYVVLSTLIVWSEVTFFITSPVLSVFAVAVKAASDAAHYTTAVAVCGATVAYLSEAAYFTVFRIRIFDYYYIAGDHLTDENSLLFIGTLLSRLTPPLCLNFLGLTHLDRVESDGDDDTSFTKIMGHLQLIPFIAAGFNIYFPILILLLCFATYFNLGSRFLQYLGFHQYIGEDEMTQDFIDEGRSLLVREKRLRSRQMNEGGVQRRYRYGTYRKIDRTETEGVELRSGRLSADGNPESLPRFKPLRSTRQKSYGAADSDDRRPLLADGANESPSAPRNGQRRSSGDCIASNISADA